MRSYPKYKPSGVNWIEEIPENWIFTKLKFLTNQIVDGTHFTPEYLDDGIPFLRVTDIKESCFDLSDIKKISYKEHKELSKRCKPEKGDLLLSKNGTIGRTIIVDWDYEFSIFVSLCLIKFKKVFLAKFADYVFKSNLFDQQISDNAKAVTIQNLHLEKIKEFEIVFPSLSEQQQIADFLDYKTEQCDRFIANRQKQIELLNEQKASIINKAVTKGINPNVKMKASGIDLIGEIPENWGVWKLKFLTNKIGSGVTPLGGSQVYKTEGVAFFRSQNIYNDRFELSNISFIDEETHQDMQNSQVKIGDILLNITGASIGRCFLFSGEYPEANVNQHVCIIRANKKIMFQFLHSVMISEIGQNQIFSKQSGTNREGLNFEQLKNFDVPLPSEREQIKILDFIKKETSTIETLISKYQKQIELMQEYRTALISQAVTGKIDVREWKPKTK